LPICSADGRTVFYDDLSNGSSVVRCEQDRCSRLARGPVGGLALSTDEERLAFVDYDNRGMFVRWVDARRGGSLHGPIPIETACTPRWSSGKNLWVSRRRGRTIVWTEIDTDKLLPTGKTFPGSRDCTDGVEDPVAPTAQTIGLAEDVVSRLRLLPNKDLPAGEEAR
jgi:hypothetical protein